MFQLIAKIGGDVTGFKLATDKASQIAGNFTKTLSNNITNAFGAGAILAFARSIVGAADRIGDLADATGLSTDEVQAFDSILSKAGSSMESFQNFLTKIGDARREAIDGNQKLIGTFQALGISIEQLQKLGGKGDLARAIGAGLSRGQFTPESEDAILSALGGQKLGPKLRSALKEAGRGITSRDLIQFDESDIQLLSKADDLLGSLGRQLKVFGLRAVENLTPITKLFSVLGRAQVGGTEPAAPGRNVFAPPRDLTDERERAAKVQLQIAEQIFQIKLKGMTLDERRVAIEDKIRSLTIEGIELFRQGKFEEAEKRKLEALRLEAALPDIKDEKIAKPQAEATALQRIGAFVPAGSSFETTARKQLTQQEIIARHTAETARILRTGGEE